MSYLIIFRRRLEHDIDFQNKFNKTLKKIKKKIQQKLAKLS